MKKQDLYFVIGLIAFFSPFFISTDVYAGYISFNQHHGFIMSFIKFAILATTGEVIGLRIVSGVYNKVGFGIVPRAIVWGVLGITIKIAFIIFATGVPPVLAYSGMENIAEIMKGGLTLNKLLVAFSISVAINLIYAPIMMSLHKITDTHIINNGGTVKGFFTSIKVSDIMANMDWRKQWGFVFKKTIPFFWIPAHTITFLLPADMQVLFAAILGIALGIILAIASLQSTPAKA
jgi:hypothetical protein